MDFLFSVFLNQHKSLIIREWVEKLHTECGDQYASRPVEELKKTISLAVDANFHVLVNNDYSRINDFIDKITDMRLKAGFLLSDVQKAFELYRVILIELLLLKIPREELYEVFRRLNHCLAYTIHRFSDHFQDMHQKKILQQNKELEQIVKKRTAALQESEKKYKTLVEEINDGYFIIQDGMIVYANQAFCKMHEDSLENILGNSISKFVAASDRGEILKIYSRKPDNKTISQVFEYKRLTKSGSESPTEIRGKTIAYDDKMLSIGICRDLTDRVLMEKKVRDNERMAYIGQITASLSHEIRNPLSAIKMNLQILSSNLKVEGNDKRRIDISESETIRLEKILNQLLDFAKPLELDLESCNICHLVNSYIELLEMKFREKELDISIDFEEDLPTIKADGDKLGQAFINIFINAVESTDMFGQVTVAIKRKIENNIEYASVSIADTGEGIDDRFKDEIFRPFFTKKTKGVGLGLANVKRIVEAHNGFVKAEGNKSGGASFIIMIPTGNI